MKGSNKKIQHITNLLNNSKTKIAYSFKKSNRFVQDKSVSPNKFYDLPSSLSKLSSSLGIGNRTSFQKVGTVQPGRYRIVSQFDLKKSEIRITPKKTTFGINRDVEMSAIKQYYKGKSQKSIVSPGQYNIKDPIDQKHFYIGRKVERESSKTNLNHLSSFSYFINDDSFSKLSTYRNNASTYRMKTEYYPKSQLQTYDNKVPGPGAYTVKNTLVNANSNSVHRKKANSSYGFGVGEKMKGEKASHLGPGYYKIFSQFGNK